MIILFHNGVKPIKYLNTQTEEEFLCNEKTIQKSLYNLSYLFPKDLLVWCVLELEPNINYKEIQSIFHHQLIFASYGNSSLSNRIGYVDQHCFINVKKDVKYPTWMMSGDIGGAYATVIKKSKDILNVFQPFDLYLSSFAKQAMPEGLLCYSTPAFLNKEFKKAKNNRSNKNISLFKFVKRHYKIQWIFILFFNILIYEKRFYLWSLLIGMFTKSRAKKSIDLKDIKVLSTRDKVRKDDFKVDVLIPTLGRKEHLYNVLKDLSQQTILPKKVIIVEQNAVEGTTSELGYLKDSWPFEIDHTFIHQLGACNARNIALSKISGNWVFFADDDVRFDRFLLEKSYNKINKYGTGCIVLGCLQKGEKYETLETIQSGHFGSGTSIVRASVVDELQFKKEHEFGFGEDSDFGMQLRNMGIDILSTPEISMLHLKAPIGGFRYQFKNDWYQDVIQPKPSPTVMAYQLKHLTKEQFFGYKTLLFIKFYKKQKIKNPILYLKKMNVRWSKSIYLANKMMPDEV